MSDIKDRLKNHVNSISYILDVNPDEIAQIIFDLYFIKKSGDIQDAIEDMYDEILNENNPYDDYLL